MEFYKNILLENLDGVTQFISRITNHQGKVNIEKLHVVEFDASSPRVRMGRLEDKKSDFIIATGGEVVNSFSPLYEISYFFNSLFLAGVGTAILHKNVLQQYKKIAESERCEAIKSDLLLLTES